MRLAAAKFPKLCPTIAPLLMLLNGCGAGNHRVLEEVSEQVYAIESSANITIHNYDGAVLVYGSNINEVRVRSVKRAYSHERLNQITIDVSVKPGAVSISAKAPRQPKWAFSDHSGTVDCTIVVPATASISALDLNAGEVLLDSMRGPEVRARLNDGRMIARNCFTNLDITVNRGTLALSYEWWQEENFSAEATMIQGNAWIWLPSEAAFHLLARAAHGKIANDFNDLPVSAHSSGTETKLDQMINGGGSATINVRVEKGDVKIAEANP
ncbi:MAG TPA: DUF4097 family beta strand repeat-containing protein [Candidatus Udaeobacter sp.]